MDTIPNRHWKKSLEEEMDKMEWNENGILDTYIAVGWIKYKIFPLLYAFYSILTSGLY